MEGTEDFDKLELPPGCALHRGYLPPAAQGALLDAVRRALDEAPLFTPAMPRTGKPFSVRMSNCGPLGWVSDKAGGYRYQPVHPVTGKPWPPIPDMLLRLWSDLADPARGPQACLINYYVGKARMGLHRDEDEKDFSAPILSVSLGDTAIFRIGGLRRRDPVISFELRSGDVLVMGGPSRLRYHGVGRVLPGTSDLLAEGGRVNLTLRHVGTLIEI
jgi:alkylated DNA repair protein (DNA oxidative demethylase)